MRTARSGDPSVSRSRLDYSGCPIPSPGAVPFLSRLGRHFGVIVAVTPNDVYITFLDSDDQVCLSFAFASGHDLASDFSPATLREIKLGIPGNGTIRPAQLVDPCLNDRSPGTSFAHIYHP